MTHVTILYAGILGLMGITLGSLAGRLRAPLNVSVGDGGNPTLLLAMRRHANFSEWVPLALIIIALLEMNGVPKLAIHILGAALVVVRLSHAVALRGDVAQGTGRLIGAAGTVLVLLVASIWAITCFFLQA